MQPGEIRDASFTIALRGYRPEDVRAFLGRAAEEVEALVAERDRVRAELASLHQAAATATVPAAPETPRQHADAQTIGETLLLAKQYAEDLRQRAAGEAQDVVRKAEMEAGDRLRAAAQEAERLLLAARTEADALVRDADAKATAARNVLQENLGRLDALVARRNALLDRFAQLAAALQDTDTLAQKARSLSETLDRQSAQLRALAIEEPAASGRTPETPSVPGAAASAAQPVTAPTRPLPADPVALPAAPAVQAPAVQAPSAGTQSVPSQPQPTVAPAAPEARIDVRWVPEAEASGAARGAAEAGEPVVLLVGPCDQLPAIEDLLDDLHRAPGLVTEFRLFRDGLYRVDGRTADRAALAAWLRDRPHVASVELDGETIHVLPRQAQP